MTTTRSRADYVSGETQRHANTSNAAGPSRAQARAPSQAPFQAATQPVNRKWLPPNPSSLGHVLNLFLENFGLMNHGLIQHPPVPQGAQQWPNGHIRNPGGYHDGSQQQVPQVPQRGMSSKRCVWLK